MAESFRILYCWKLFQNKKIKQSKVTLNKLVILLKIIAKIMDHKLRVAKQDKGKWNWVGHAIERIEGIYMLPKVGFSTVFSLHHEIGLGMPLEELKAYICCLKLAFPLYSVFTLGDDQFFVFQLQRKVTFQTLLSGFRTSH